MSDLRNAREYEDETKRITAEIANIELHFRDKHLLGYQKKKYVAKLLFVHIIGRTDTLPALLFGGPEAVALVRLNVYGEQQMGFLALPFVAPPAAKAWGAVEPHLGGNDHSVALALAFLGTVDRLPVWAGALEPVYHLAVLPESSGWIRRKAMLVLARLVGHFPDEFAPVADRWAPRLVAHLGDSDPAVVMAAASLAAAMLRHAPCEQVLPLAAARLSKLVTDGCAPADCYYGVPAPWCTVRLLQVVAVAVETHEPDSATLSQLQRVVASIVRQSTEEEEDAPPPKLHAKSAVLNSALKLMAWLEPPPEVIVSSVGVLISLLTRSDPLARYVTLDALVPLTASSSVAVTAASRHLETIVKLLHDRDILVRRRALDLVYTLTQPATVEMVCRQLLRFFPSAEYPLRPELATKVAALAEQHATLHTWYVSTILQLIQLAGPHIAPEVWQRCVQIMVNNRDVRKLGVEAALENLGNGNSSSMVKVAAFVVGEYGELVLGQEINGETVSPESQMRVLVKQYSLSGSHARAMILTALVKMYRRHEALRPAVLDFWEGEMRLLDIEAQIRAGEYLRLATIHPGYLDLVVKEMPGFETKVLPLAKGLGSVGTIVRARAESSVGRSESAVGRSASTAGRGRAESTAAPPDTGFYRALQYDAGIAYDLPLLRVIFRVTRSQHTLTFQLTYKNPLTMPVSALTAGVRGAGHVTELPETEIAPDGKTTQTIVVTVARAARSPPLVVNIAFQCGTLTQVRLALPTSVFKTLVPSAVDPAQFQTRWTQLAGVGEWSGRYEGSVAQPDSAVSRMLQRVGLSVVEAAEDRYCAAGIAHSAERKCGVLVVVASSREGRDYVVTVRATGGVERLIGEDLLSVVKHM